MSENQETTHTGRRNRRETVQETQETAAPSNGQDNGTSTDTNGLDNAGGDGASVRTVDIEMTVSEDRNVPKLKVTVPLKFRPGYILTDNQAKVLDAAYQRQFINNMNANIKARADRYAKATTEADRLANIPMTAGEIAALYTDYEPNVGGGPRMSTLERMRHDAAWRAWVKFVGEHNVSVMSGGAALIAALGKCSYKPEAIPTAKRRSESKEAFEARRDAATDRRLVHTTKMLDMGKYAERIQTELDAIIAERGQDKAEGDVAVDVDAEALL